MSEPKFKPQYRRLLFIDQALRKGGYPSCATLAAEWQVHPRTIQRDMDYLRDELGAPIAYDASRHGLYYEKQSWFLPSVMLTEGDVLALLIGTRVAELYKGTPMAGALKGVYDRLAGMLPGKVTLAPELVFARFSFLGAPARPIDPEVWKLVVRALLHQRVLTIAYTSHRSSGGKTHVIHPYHMANIEGEWYVLARNVRWGDIAQYALGRVTAATVSDETFTIPAEVDIPALLAERVGRLVLEPAGKPVTVRLRFRPRVAAYIAERIWHPRQKLTHRRDGSVDLSLPATAEAALIPWVLSFGPHAEVLAPRALRERVARVLAAAAGPYGPVRMQRDSIHVRKL